MKQRVVVTFTEMEFAGLLGLCAAGDTPAEFLKHLLSEHQYRLRQREARRGPFLVNGEAP